MANMEITTRVGCLMGCQYCPQDLLIKSYQQHDPVWQMSFETFRICLNKIPSDVNIHFSGMAEPWLVPDCTRMLLLAHEKGHTIAVYTTLVGMDSRDLEALAEVPFKDFEVHLPSKEGREKIKVTEEYLTLLRQLVAGPIAAHFHIQAQEVHPAVKEILGDIPVARYKPHSRAGHVTIPGQPPVERREGYLGCQRDLRANVLLPNGDVLLCCMDYGMKHVLGNLLKMDYEDLFSGEIFRSVVKGLNDPGRDILCRYCDFCAFDIPRWKKYRNALQWRWQNLKKRLS